jgi:hypothetical protein
MTDVNYYGRGHHEAASKFLGQVHRSAKYSAAMAAYL